MMVSAPRDARMAISALCSPATDKEEEEMPPPLTLGATASGFGDRCVGEKDSAHASKRPATPPPSVNMSGLLHLPPTISASAAPIPPAAAGKQRAMKRRMSNSERGKLYRSRRKSYMDTLTRQVQELQQEIATLEKCGRMRHELAQALARHGGGGGSPYWRVSMPAAAYSRVVCEYFAAFEAGLPSVPSAAADGARVLRQSPRQSVFLRTLVDDALVFDGAVGVNHLVHCWESHTRAHASLRLKLEHLDVVTSDPRAVVQAAAELSVRFDRQHLAAMFPQLVREEADGERVRKLLSLEVAYPVRVHFYFGEDGKIAQYDAQVDLVGGWTRALGSVREASELLEHLSIRDGH